jgi:diguanylate cyclase
LTTDVAVISDTEMSLGWHVIPSARFDSTCRGSCFTATNCADWFNRHLIACLLSYRLANRFSRPIENLAKSAHAVEKGQEDIQFEANTSIREITGLSQSLNSMTETLLTQKHQLMDANITLEQKVQNARRNSTSQYRIRKIGAL